MPQLLPSDELNILRTKLESIPISEDKRRKIPREDILDELLDLYLLAYANGVQDAAESLEASDPEEVLLEMTADSELVRRVLYRKIADEDFVDRVTVYAAQGDVESIMRVADTDVHRIYNEAAHATAASGRIDSPSGRPFRINKTWLTMLDDRVRDPHEELEGVTLDIDDYFYTTDGASARFPGDFGVPELDINCRCILRYSRAEENPL